MVTMRKTFFQLSEFPAHYRSLSAPLLDRVEARLHMREPKNLDRREAGGPQKLQVLGNSDRKVALPETGTMLIHSLFRATGLALEMAPPVQTYLDPRPVSGRMFSKVI